MSAREMSRVNSLVLRKRLSQRPAGAIMSPLVKVKYKSSTVLLDGQ